MDTLRGTFDTGVPADESDVWDAETRISDDTADRNPDEGTSRELPPEAIGQDERRMQVRAYNHWASLLGDATFPSIEDLEPRDLNDFGPNSVLLDFSAGIEDPGVQYLGDKLADECGAASSHSVTPINKLSDVPPRSLLSRITDHYMQILANQAPIGFEAEFVNQRGASILYRGILLPYSSDNETIDFIFGVINWKEMADAATADELLLEIDQALETTVEEAIEDEDQPQKHHADPVTEWADSPAHESEVADMPQIGQTSEPVLDNVSPLLSKFSEDSDDLPAPDFGQYTLDDPETDEFGEEIEDDDDGAASYGFASLADYIEAPAKKAIDLDADHFDPDDYEVEEGLAHQDTVHDEPAQFETNESEPNEFEPVEVEPSEIGQAPSDFAPASEIVSPVAINVANNEAGDLISDLPEAAFSQDASLHDCLASARELAQTANVSEDRSRHALYAAVSRAYDFSLGVQGRARRI